MTTDPSWARVGVPLEAYAAGFRVELGRLGYTPLTAAGHVRLMAHLARWLAAEGLDASALTPATVEAYFAQRRTVGYVNERTSRALRPLLDLCALTDTLIADADGIYHPGDFNDRLVLGLKGTMSEALPRYRGKASYGNQQVMPT